MVVGVVVGEGEGEISVGRGEAELFGVGEPPFGELPVGVGEGVAVGVGLKLFSTTKKDTSNITTNKTATRINILCCLRTCIYNNEMMFSIFIIVAVPSTQCLVGKFRLSKNLISKFCQN